MPNKKWKKVAVNIKMPYPKTNRLTYYEYVAVHVASQHSLLFYLHSQTTMITREKIDILSLFEDAKSRSTFVNVAAPMVRYSKYVILIR